MSTNWNKTPTPPEIDHRHHVEPLPSSARAISGIESDEMTGFRRRQSVVATDGWYGWVVVAACFVVMALSVGNVYAFGVIYVELMDAFGSSESTTAWVGSIETSLLYLTGEIF